MKKSIIVLAFLVLSLQAFSQNAIVHIARKGLYTGAAGPVRVFLDDELICKINAQKFTTHDVAAGKHKLTVQSVGNEAKDAKWIEKGALTLELEAGKEYYLRVNKYSKGLTSYLYLEEITANSWPKLKAGLEEDNCR